MRSVEWKAIRTKSGHWVAVSEYPPITLQADTWAELQEEVKAAVELTVGRAGWSIVVVNSLKASADPNQVLSKQA